MQPVDFHESNIIIGRNQPQYVPLPAYTDRLDKEGKVTFCVQLSQEELNELNSTGKLWLTQLTFGGLFQPVVLSVQKPTLLPILTNAGGTFTPIPEAELQKPSDEQIADFEKEESKQVFDSLINHPDITG